MFNLYLSFKLYMHMYVYLFTRCMIFSVIVLKLRNTRIFATFIQLYFQVEISCSSLVILHY